MTEAAKLRPEEERLLRVLLRRADALNIAYGALECEEWGCPEVKAEVLEDLEEICAEAHECFVAYRRAFGIPGPSGRETTKGGVILRGAPSHDNEEEDMERHTVEVTFWGEKVSSVTDELATKTLYRTDEGTYVVHLDQRKSGEGAALEYGVYAPGMSEHDIRVMFPELLEAQSRQ